MDADSGKVSRDTRELRLALVTPEYAPNHKGGCGVSAELYVRTMQRYGIHVDVFAFAGKREPEYSEFGSVSYFDMSPNAPLKSEIEIFRCLRGKLGNYDIVQAIGGKHLALKFLQIIDNHKPLVLIANGFDYACHNYERRLRTGCESCTETGLIKCIYHKRRSVLRVPLSYVFYKFQRFFKRRYDFIFVISDFLKTMYEGAGFEPSRLLVTYNMTDPHFLEKTVAVVRSKGPHLPVQILYVGRLDREKTVQDLLAAFSLIETREQTELVIVGSGSEEQGLRNLAEKLGIGHRIRFTGRVDYDEIYRYYGAADIFVHPAVWPEPFGRTIIEAMASGLPVIMTNNGAPPSIIRDGGLTYEPGNRVELARRIELLVNDEELRRELGRKAKGYVAEYSVENRAGLILEALMKINEQPAAV